MPLPTIPTIDQLTQERNRYYRALDERGEHSPPQEGYVDKIPEASWMDDLQQERKQMLAAASPQRTPEDIVADPHLPFGGQTLTNLSPYLHDRHFNPLSKRMREKTRDALYETGMPGHAVRNLNEGVWDIADTISPVMWGLRGGEQIQRDLAEDSPWWAALNAAFLPFAAYGVKSPMGVNLAKRIINRIADKPRGMGMKKLFETELEHYGVGEYRPAATAERVIPKLMYEGPAPREVKNPDLVEKLNAVIEQKIPRGRPVKGKYARNPRTLSRRRELFGRMHNTKWNSEEKDAGAILVDQGEDPVDVANMLDDLIGDF